jgi:predicted transcriptional regulator
MDNNKQERLLEEIVGLLAILVKRDSLQTTVIKEMSGVGFTPKRIAELLKTSPNAVSVTLHQAKKAKNKGRKEN